MKFLHSRHQNLAVKSTAYASAAQYYAQERLILTRVGFIFALCVFCLSSSFAFAESKEVTKKIYGNYLRGLFHAQVGDYRLALLELEKAKQLDRDSLHIRLKIASLLIRLGELDRAEQELKEAKRIDPDSFDASFALIILYSYAQRDAELEKEYEDFLKKASRLKPNDLLISESLAQFYFYKKNLNEAIKIYETIVKNNPQYTDGIFLLGYFHEEAGRLDEAIAQWKRVLEIEPAHAAALNSLAYIYAEAGNNLDEAEDMSKRAVAKEQENGSYIDTLGWIYFKKKNYKMAEVQLLKALSLTKDPAIYEHLGDFYIETNDQAKAVQYYREGMVNFPQAKSLQEKFQKYGKKDSIPQK
ncbi:MAG: tetratricopeptide repeat protein [Candidatus Omnitrophica bacterium]|nr:tetratricopeptide repeat protein [Candidatus Omnitrophota bacterium]